jgi:hypothetical protein
VEGRAPTRPATRDALEKELRKMSNWRRRTFAILHLDDRHYLQCAGSPAGLMLEKRVGDRQYMGSQDHPVVPFEDGTVLSFTAGKIALQANEWFRVEQVAEVFWRAACEEPEPDWIRWRDITSILYPSK